MPTNDELFNSAIYQRIQSTSLRFIEEREVALPTQEIHPAFIAWEEKFFPGRPRGEAYRSWQRDFRLYPLSDGYPCPHAIRAGIQTSLLACHETRCVGYRNAIAISEGMPVSVESRDLIKTKEQWSRFYCLPFDNYIMCTGSATERCMCSFCRVWWGLGRISDKKCRFHPDGCPYSSLNDDLEKSIKEAFMPNDKIHFELEFKRTANGGVVYMKSPFIEALMMRLSKGLTHPYKNPVDWPGGPNRNSECYRIPNPPMYMTNMDGMSFHAFGHKLTYMGFNPTVLCIKGLKDGLIFKLQEPMSIAAQDVFVEKVSGVVKELVEAFACTKGTRRKLTVVGGEVEPR